MKGSLLLGTVALLPFAGALRLVKKDVPAVVEFSIQRKSYSTNPAARDRLRKRQGTVSVDLENDLTLYFANVSLGTPTQAIALQIDTGSSDLWVNSPNSESCSARGSPCANTGTYDGNSSSSYSYVNSGFNISYADGSGASGDYATDTLVIGNTTIDDVQFGIGYESSSDQGVLGVGYVGNEADQAATQSSYPNLPKLMQDQGIIASDAFSLYLNDLDASTGSILFGGVNTDKYTGTLATLPILTEFDQYAEFLIALTAVGTNGNEGSIVSNQAMSVLLDSGSSLSYLPDNIISAIYSAFNGQYDANEGTAIVDCDLANQDGSIDFTFSGVTISVALSEAVLVGAYRGNTPICVLGFAPMQTSQAILGDTFLRSAYVVYDTSNNEISLAATNFNSTSDNIVEIASGSGGVPNATPVTTAVTSVTDVANGGGFLGGPTLLLGTSTGGAAHALITGAPVGAFGILAMAGMGAAALI